MKLKCGCVIDKCDMYNNMCAKHYKELIKTVEEALEYFKKNGKVELPQLDGHNWTEGGSDY